ncbi:FUSC family protein [Mangrovimonas sp. YM274]|uniref:FUSC family protein n=1 Tax=Mangrovimonas sp. YM274 TaxID=3070660 RepID=UPI0027DD8F4C|nr:FUSC family protein [Mangrovimonas sp. YM274]WMI68329.1 FUSC family protein [Mangrovimonas sp. YM274]
MALKNTIHKELEQLVTLKDSTRTWHTPMLTAICVGFPLLVGLYVDNLRYALISCLSGLVILYLPSSGSFTNRITTLLVSSFGFMVSFALGQFFSFSPTIAVIVFGLYSLIVHWIILYYKTAPPRSFFFIMILSISICQPFNLSTIPTKVGLVGLGTMFSCTLGLAYILWLSATQKITPQNAPVPLLKKNTYADFWEAIITGVIMAISLALGYWLKLENPYWIPISCGAVMQGASLYHIWQRTFQRILGTFLGLCLCWLLLHIANTPLMLCLFIIVLQLIVELLIIRNYAMAVIFITPLAIFLSEAANPIINDPNALITLRFWEILIGSILGAIGGWLLHKEKLRYASIRGLKKLGDQIEQNIS